MTDEPLLRCQEPGWVAAAIPDGRRGLWYRKAKDGAIEMCAGREGDDAYVCLELGADERGALLDVLGYLEMSSAFAAERDAPVNLDPLVRVLRNQGDLLDTDVVECHREPSAATTVTLIRAGRRVGFTVADEERENGPGLFERLHRAAKALRGEEGVPSFDSLAPGGLSLRSALDRLHSDGVLVDGDTVEMEGEKRCAGGVPCRLTFSRGKGARSSLSLTEDDLMSMTQDDLLKRMRGAAVKLTAGEAR